MGGIGRDGGISGHSAARAAAARGGVWQAQAMARTLGVDLVRARLAGCLDEERSRRLITSCARCPELAECMAFVGAPPRNAQAAPAFCPLADIFEMLLELPGCPR
ncbi:hypothetical protein SAMN05216257_101677 [Meinhardsimonia xiamenensis]|jgi:hypothetical protein|uniref:DUF6455 domain-containing protein n=1 Tax=Meinhardsimonia xiamenensis TaxID=990712 RepID=A0A1G8ZE26_9RHOB|nr:DUF6455 family protein [Meinhardsimonia xiamenensis]PRX37652.1 hypothetical protein LV81_01432 [Meinhardsimonia xiamenensis]SDK12874.1 hypothetical protein SAMN05216257_101677 [Meinhardsimonia xiamenensis]